MLKIEEINIVWLGISIFAILFNSSLAEIAQTSSSNKDFEFDTADLTIDIPTDYGSDHLEAFRSSVNKLIIDTKDKSKYSHLTWLSMGIPKLVHSFNVNQTNLFEFSRKGFSFQVEMLNKKTKLKLIEVIKRKYDIDVLEEQIVTLIPNSFQCSTSFYEEENNVFLKGVAKNFFSFPIRVDFKAPLGSKERVLFIEKLKNPDSDLSFDCEFKLNGKTSKTNTLQINGEQLNNNGLIEDIFGPASEVYVTREQMSSLTSELYVNLNIIEDYQMSETEFSASFIQDFIKQVSDGVQKHVNFDDAINSMSSYNFNKDLQADVIKKELGNIFKVDSTGSKSHIILNKDNYDKYDESSAIGGSSSHSASISTFFGKGELSSVSAYYGNKTLTKTSHDKSLDDQLQELNKKTEESVKWEFEGEKIIPKSIKLTKLIKAKFSKTLEFNRIKRHQFDALFSKSFTLYTRNKNIQKNEQLSDIAKELKEIKKLLNQTEQRIELQMEKMNIVLNKLKKQYTEPFNQIEKIQVQVNKREYRNTKTITGHTGWVYSLAVLPNGDLASGSYDNTIKIWNTNDGSLKRTLTGHTSYVDSLAVLSNGNLASGSNDTTIKIWNTNDGSLKRTLTGHTGNVYSLVVLPNGDLASCSFDNTIKIWNTNDGSLKKTLTGHTYAVLSLAVLPNGDLASGSGDYTIKIWNTNDGILKRTLTGHTNYVYSLAVLPNGDLASGSFDYTIKIWNTNDGILKRTLTGHTDHVDYLAVLPNGDLVSGSHDETIKIWNTNDGSLKRTLTGHTGNVYSLVVLPNGDLASCSFDNTIKIWNTNDGSLKKTLTGHTYAVLSLAVLPNGDLASGSIDNTIKIWNTNDGILKRTLTGHTNYVYSLAVLPNGDLASGSGDKTIKIWS